MRNISPLRYRWSFPAKFFFYPLSIATLLAPIPFVFFKPGVPDNVAGNIITIKDSKTYPINGKLFITSILVTNPDSPVFGAETIVNWALGPHVVLPKESVYHQSGQRRKSNAIARTKWNHRRQHQLPPRFGIWATNSKSSTTSVIFVNALMLSTN